MDNLAWLGIAAVLLGVYVWRTTGLIKSGGFDPALVTYAGPLAYKNFWAARILIIVSAGLLGLSQPSANLGLVFLLFSALAQSVLLYLFGRQHTQPSFYYFMVIVLALTALTMGAGWPAGTVCICLFCLQELYLRHWAKHSRQYYDDWVARVAAKIQREHRHLATELEPRYWRWTLHLATTESIARPAIVRLAERLYFNLKKPTIISTGIMQVAAVTPLTDGQSIRYGSRLIAEILEHMPHSLTGTDEQLDHISRHYNGSAGYAQYLRATLPGVNKAIEDIERV